MSDRPFADEGEVRTSFEALRAQIADMDRRHSDDHRRIEAQTTKTNGRVSNLERQVGRLDQFKAAAQAVIALLVIQAGWAIAVYLKTGG